MQHAPTDQVRAIGLDNNGEDRRLMAGGVGSPPSTNRAYDAKLDFSP